LTNGNKKTARPIISGHGKFVFRQGWLKKGFDLTIDDPTGLIKEDAYIKLGVGKNMASSIRHWCQAVQILDEDTSNKKNAMKATPLGELILGAQGSDPYMEKSGTLWLLHWLLANNPVRGLIYQIFFSKLYEIEFKKYHLTELLDKELPKYGIPVTPAKLNREVNVFLRTYLPARSNDNKKSIEDSLDCPLAELNLIQHIPSDDIYRFRHGPKRSLSLNIYAYSLISFIKEHTKTRNTMGVDEVIYEPGSPGMVFKLDENSSMEYIEALQEKTSGVIQIQDTAGLRQIYLHDLDSINETQLIGELH
jgi:hypothetical protein